MKQPHKISCTVLGTSKVLQYNSTQRCLVRHGADPGRMEVRRQASVLSKFTVLLGSHHTLVTSFFQSITLKNALPVDHKKCPSVMFSKSHAGKSLDVRLLDEGLWFGEQSINRTASTDGPEFFSGTAFWTTSMAAGFCDTVFTSRRRNQVAWLHFNWVAPHGIGHYLAWIYWFLKQIVLWFYCSFPYEERFICYEA